VRADGFDGHLFLSRVHQIEDLCCGSYAAHFAALEVLAIQHAGKHFGKLLKRGWLHAAKGGDPKHHVVTQFLFEELENISSLMAIQVN